MADSTLSNLSEATSVAAGDLLYAVVSGNARKVQAKNLRHAQEILDSADPSAVAQVDFALPAGFETYRIIGWLQPATDNVDLWLRLSNDGGTTFDNGASDYDYAVKTHAESDVAASLASAGDSKLVLLNQAGNASNERVQFEITLVDPGNASFGALVQWQGVYNFQGAGNTAFFVGGGFRIAAAAYDAVRLLFASGNIAAGHVALIGIKGS